MITRPRNLLQADPYFDSVVLLAPLSGEDGDTTSTDLSNSAHTLTFNGTAALDGDIRKYGFTSCVFDGNSDYLSIADSADLSFGSGDFTIETHIRFNGAPGTSGHVIAAKWTNVATREWFFGYRTTQNLEFVHSVNGTNGITSISKSWSPSADTWYHVAVCRDGSNMRLFVDGTQLGTTDTTISTNTIIDTASPVYIGAYTNNGSPFLEFFDGNIENVRITKGVARYTAAFTPPERAFPTAKDFGDPYFSSVQLLMPMDGADAGTSFPDLSNNTFTFTPTTVTTSTEQIKYGTASAKISGAIDRYLSSTDTIFPTSASSFTIEAWVYILGNAYGGANITAGQATHPIISQSLEGATGGGVRDQGLGVKYDGTVQFYRGSALGGGSNQSITTAASAVSSSQWVHVACVYDSVAAAISLFVDGTKLVDGTAFTNGGWYDTAQPVYIGHWLVSGYTGYRSSANMHIDDLRVTYAVRYTDSFTPTGPHLTA